MTQLLDSAVLEMKEICILVSGLAEIQEYVMKTPNNTGNQVYKRYEMVRILKPYKTERLEDIFIYFTQDGYVLSGVNGALNRNDYSEVYYSDTSQMRSDFYSHLDNMTGYPSLFVLDAQGDNPQLGVSIKYNLGKRWGSCTVSCILDEDYLKKYIFDFSAVNMGSGLIFGENKEMLLSMYMGGIPYDLHGFTGQNDFYEASFNNKKYIMQVRQSDVINAYYVFATPTSSFWAQLLEMRVFSAISILLCVFAGAMLIGFFSRKLYEPLGTVVQMLKMQNSASERNLEGLSEFNFIERRFIELNEKKLEGERALGERKKRLIENGIWNLMKGNHEDKDARELGFDSEYYAVGVIQIEDSNKENDSIYHFVIDNVFEEIFNRTDKGYVLSLDNQRECFLLNMRGASRQLFQDMIQEGKEFLERNGLLLSIGYSEVHEGIAEVPIAYQEAMEAMSYRFLMGKGEMLPYSVSMNRNAYYLNEAHADIEDDVCQYLNEVKAYTDVKEYVSALFDRFQIDGLCSFTAAECFKFDMVNVMNRLGIRYWCTLEEREDILKGLQGSETIEELKIRISDALQSLLEKKSIWEKQNDICLKVRDYINQNYHDEQLSVSGIGAHVGLSSSYLTKLYKAAFATTIANDISEIRLAHARELLIRTMDNIEEIAKKTGFTNISVFTKAFKKKEGIPPGKYRQANRRM